MQAKKKLIYRLAFWAGVVLVVAATTAVSGLMLEDSRRDQYAEDQERAKQKRIEASRAYLAELAERVKKLPADATLVGEIESRYFEEQANGPFYVWAMDTRGEFAFGVPQSAFRKINAIYDREVTPRLKEGVFLDRQTFLMSLVDDSDEIGPELVSDDKAVLATELVERGRRFRLDRWEPEGAFVLSIAAQGRGRRAAGQPVPQARAAARADPLPRRPQPRGRDRRRRRDRRGLAAVPLGAAADLGLRGRARARRAPRAALRVPDRDLVARRPRRLPDRAAGGRAPPDLPRLRARGERGRLLPALRARPGLGHLPGLPLSAEARLGLLPGLPQRDQGAGSPGPRSRRRARSSFRELRRRRARSGSQEVSCPHSRSREAAATKGSAVPWSARSSSRARSCRSCPGTPPSRAWRSTCRLGSPSSPRSASSRRWCWSRGSWESRVSDAACSSPCTSSPRASRSPSPT